MAASQSFDEALARFEAAVKAMEGLATQSRQAGQRAAAADLEYAALKADRTRIADELADVRRKGEALIAAQKAAEPKVAEAMDRITAALADTDDA